MNPEEIARKVYEHVIRAAISGRRQAVLSVRDFPGASPSAVMEAYRRIQRETDGILRLNRFGVWRMTVEGATALFERLEEDPLEPW